MESVRADKWLWAARFFKTRALAARACELSRVDLRGQPAKAARDIRVGDRLEVRTEGGIFTIDVLGLSDVRGPAATAQTLFRETDESRELRKKAAEERRMMSLIEALPAGKPSKRDRRTLARVRGRG